MFYEVVGLPQHLLPEREPGYVYRGRVLNFSKSLSLYIGQAKFRRHFLEYNAIRRWGEACTRDYPIMAGGLGDFSEGINFGCKSEKWNRTPENVRQEKPNKRRFLSKETPNLTRHNNISHLF